MKVVGIEPLKNRSLSLIINLEILEASPGIDQEVSTFRKIPEQRL
jgi:hypothetical protein